MHCTEQERGSESRFPKLRSELAQPQMRRTSYPAKHRLISPHCGYTRPTVASQAGPAVWEHGQFRPRRAWALQHLQDVSPATPILLSRPS